jgi:hypothetical protein
MGDNTILLTYESIHGYSTFAWLQDIDEVNEFVEDNSEIKALIECIDATYAENIDLSELGK